MPNAEPSHWLEFAHTDLEAAATLSKAEWHAPACFHAQQAVEKSLKAFLLSKQKTVPRIHALPELLARCEALDAAFHAFRHHGEQLDKFYKPTRYPDAVGLLPHGMPVKADADSALEIARTIYDFVRGKIISV